MTAHLRIHVQSLQGVTFLKTSYAEPPFKICDITENKKHKTLRLMLMSSSPGILNADAYEISVNLGPGTCLQLHTQAYQRLFTMTHFASHATSVSMADHSSFCYIPHPVVPHKNSSYESRMDVHLSAGCTLIYGEVLTCGRKLNGEVFTFSKYQSTSRIFLHGKLCIKENLLLQPALINPSSVGQLQQYTHQASMVCLHPGISVQSLIEELYILLKDEEEISIGITSAPINGILLRVMGQRAEQLFHILKRVATTVLQKHSHKSLAYAI